MATLSSRATGLSSVNQIAFNELGVDPAHVLDSGDILLYAKSDGKLYTRDDQGEIKEVGSGGGASVEILESETSQELAVGDIIYFDNSGVTPVNKYDKAIASSTSTAEVVGVVSEKTGTSGSFKYVVTTAGYIEAGLSGLTAGEVYFLSDSVAGLLTTSEPSAVGHVSRPVLLATGADKGFVLPYRGVVVGGANARTQISLPQGSSQNVQDFSSYEAAKLDGYVYINGTTDYRFYIEAQVSKNGAGDDYNLSYQTSGDTPPVGFDVAISSAGMLSITLPSDAALDYSAYINYALNAPAVGTSFPLSIDASAVTSGTLAVDRMPLPNGMLRLDTGNGGGSSADCSVRRFANISEHVGDAFTYVDSATDGMSVTINRDMIAHISYTDRDDNNNRAAGICLNAPINVSITDMTANQRLMMTYTDVGLYNNVSCTVRLSQGDVIRCQGFKAAGVPNGAGDEIQFIITEVVRL